MSETQLVHIKLSNEMYRAVQRQKRRQHKTISACIREALADWLAEFGDIVDPGSVSWGGFRESDPIEDDTEVMPVKN